METFDFPEAFQDDQSCICIAMAPIDDYSDDDVERIMTELECASTGGELTGVSCGKSEAQTWDHLFPLVVGGEPSGHGHTYGNLVPACKDCNSRKGNKSWSDANESINANDPVQHEKVNRILSAHLIRYPRRDVLVPEETKKRLDVIKIAIFQKMHDADEILGITAKNK